MRKIAERLMLIAVGALSSCGPWVYAAGPLPIPAKASSGDWVLHGRTFGEDRFSPLTQIDEKNVGRLGLSWAYKIQPDRAMEATPLVVDGVMYVSGPYSVVYALDAATGREIWTFDPKVDRGISNRGCCGPISRGVAYQDGRVFVGSYDGRLIALNARTGRPEWVVDTIVDHSRDYTVSGAPRLADNAILIGNSGAEYGVRGYVSAYDQATGALLWRFFTVPGGKDDPNNDTKAMKVARPTWFGDAYPEQGGGGTVWDSMVYDPELRLVYIGVGNASFWSRKARSQGRGDNLFLSSIVALDPATGEYRWHYQTTPGDEWDFTATQHMILANLLINGRERKVLMQAPKNGFFYVLDRETGKLISARNYVPVTWATGVDAVTGRPTENGSVARYEDGKLKIVEPANMGGHNWQPMSFNPQTGLVYIPVMENATYYQALPKVEARQRGLMDVGAAVVAAPAGRSDAAAAFPNTADTRVASAIAATWTGKLIAWDPVRQRRVWAVDLPSPWNGGTLTTAGNLVFEGNSRGELVAYRATDGKFLWRAPTNSGVVAPPITYSIRGEQYIALAVGWGGALPLAYGNILRTVGTHTEARILAFKLDGTASLPAPVVRKTTPSVLPWSGDSQKAASGALTYAYRCGVCHGLDVVSGGETPDLRLMSSETFGNFSAIVKGAYSGMGMPNFSATLTDAQIEEVRDYIAKRNGDMRSELGAGVHPADARKP